MIHQRNNVSISNVIEYEEIFPLNDSGNCELSQTYKCIHEWMNLYLLENQYDSDTLHLYLFPVGSITYHKSYPDNPKDFLICFPGLIKIKTIYDHLVPYLNLSGKFQSIAILHTRLVPVLQLIKSNCVFEIIICFLPTQYCLTKKPSFDLRNPSQIILEQMDLKSILAFNSLRNCLLIRDQLNHSFSLYQETLFQLKKWTIFKLIYYKSTSYYLNGTALAIMLGCVFISNTPATNVIGNLYMFFRHYIEMNWSRRSISVTNTDFVDNMRAIVIQNPDFMTPSNGVMTVLTPAMPHQNCTRGINKLALDRIINQFKEAFFILEKSTLKMYLDNTFMQPLTLIDFIIYTKSIKSMAPQIVLISIIEEKKIENRGTFCEFEEMIKSKLKFTCNQETIIHFPLSIRNVVFDNKLRIRHFLLFNYNTVVKLCQLNLLKMTDNDIPYGMSYCVETIQENDYRIMSMNFDNMETIVRLIYTHMSTTNKHTDKMI